MNKPTKLAGRRVAVPVRAAVSHRTAAEAVREAHRAVDFEAAHPREDDGKFTVKPAPEEAPK